MATHGPMSGVRVLEFGHYIAAPFCAQILADQGADVIKVEPPGGGPRRNSDPVVNKGGYFSMVNRNKRSIEVDLKSDDGRRVLDALVATSDVLVTNFGPGVPQKLGFGYDHLAEINPRLVYVHLTGFGHDSPYANRPAFDGIIQAMSGLLHLTGERDRPPSLAGEFVPDHVTALYGTLAVMFGLRSRDVSGRGSFQDLAMLDAMLTFLGASLSDVIDHGESPMRNGGRVPRSYAGTYEAADGYVYLAPMAPRMWEGIAAALEQPDLLDFYSTRPGTTDTRMANRVELDKRIEAWTQARPVAEIEAAMSAAGVPNSAIYPVERIAADPNVAHRKLVRRIPLHGGRHVHVAASPFAVDEATYLASPPLVGQHTGEILAELGVGPDGRSTGVPAS